MAGGSKGGNKRRNSFQKSRASEPEEKPSRDERNTEDDDLDEEENEEDALDAAFGTGAGRALNNNEDEGEDDDEDEDDDDKTSRSGGGKKKKKSKGGFHAMKLSDDVMLGIRGLGFKQPTPIQRKAIPPALLGRDVVAMARTGSGKTAAFLIPVIERLKAHTPDTRCVILSPTRELAQQTYKIGRSIAKKTDLRFCLLQGGDSLEAQFDALAACPDVIVATPGRLAHLLVEAHDFSIGKLDMLVVDEADRLFEMGFQAQLQEIVSRTPDSRQTLLFSATMPKMLAEFARVKLREPELIRLDTDVRVSDTLTLAFLKVRSSERPAALLHVLRTQIDCVNQSTIIFCGTKHEVEFVGALIRAAELIPMSALPKSSTGGGRGKKPRRIPSSKHAGKGGKRKVDDVYEEETAEDHRGVGVAHGTMDQKARTASLERFRSGEVKIFVVTDLAARGLDIPHVNNVINYDFPDKSKLFVHRVGRAARQGRVGTAISLVSTDEMGHLVDVMLYLGRPIIAEKREDTQVGVLPQPIIDDGVEFVNQKIESDAVLEKLWTGANNAHKMYVKTRQDASKRSIKRAKELPDLPIHPLFALESGEENSAPSPGAVTLETLSAFRPKKTTFEVEQSKGGSNSVTLARVAEFNKQIKAKELLNGGGGLRGKNKRARSEEEPQDKDSDHDDDNDEDDDDDEEAERENVRKVAEDMRKKKQQHQTLTSDLGDEGKVRLSAAERKRAKKRGEDVTAAKAMVTKRAKVVAAPAPGAPTGAFRDDKYYVSLDPSDTSASIDHEYESQLKINRLEDAVMDLGDDTDLAKQARSFQWDKRKKKFVQATLKDHVNAKRLKKGPEALDVKNAGEAYEKWSKRTRKRIGATDSDTATTDVRQLARMRKEAKAANKATLPNGRRLRDELKNEEQLIKEQMTKKKKSEKLKLKKQAGGKKQQKRPKAGSDAKALRIGKHKPKPGTYSRSKLIKVGGKKNGGKGGRRN